MLLTKFSTMLKIKTSEWWKLHNSGVFIKPYSGVCIVDLEQVYVFSVFISTTSQYPGIYWQDKCPHSWVVETVSQVTLSLPFSLWYMKVYD